uniref:Reverse transcriptase domain-containing protein n=1 Tax=Amphiprion percula TaxID=161767 RepID=A0A3P8RTI8_AMPPE
MWYYQNPQNTVSYSTNNENGSVRDYSPFRPKSTFIPCVNNPTLSTFTKKVSYEVEKIFQGPREIKRYNLTKNEHDALDWISKRTDVIIKSADKGGAVCVWSKDKYVTEALRQLNDEECYSRLSVNPIDNVKKELLELLDVAKSQNWISNKEYDFLIRDKPRFPCFYMLPKVHKNLMNPPGRPIISGNDSVTEPASKFVDYFIKPYVLKLPSYLQDSTQVLQKISQMGNIGSCLMATMDFESLFSNIVHKEGLAALRHYLGNRDSDQMPPTDFLIQLTEWTLRNNIFLFEDKLYKQEKGTAMGACFAPNYANLFLG